jgi:hypothetical protein
MRQQHLYSAWPQCAPQDSNLVSQFADQPFSHRHEVYLVWAICQSKRAHCTPEPCKMRVLANTCKAQL